MTKQETETNRLTTAIACGTCVVLMLLWMAATVGSTHLMNGALP